MVYIRYRKLYFSYHSLYDVVLMAPKKRLEITDMNRPIKRKGKIF